MRSMWSCTKSWFDSKKICMRQTSFIIIALLLSIQGGCVTSIITSFLPYPIAIDKIPWDDPQELSLNDCPNIDGVYELVPKGEELADNGLTSLFDVIGYPDRPTTVWESFNPRDPIPSAIKELRSPVDKQQLIAIHISGNKAVKLRLNKSGKVFYKKTVVLDPTIHPEERRAGWECRVGCYQGAYIYRRVASSDQQPEEAAGKERMWFETRLRKLPNGDLEVHYKDSSIGSFDKNIRMETCVSIYPAYHGPLPDLTMLLAPK